MLLQWIPWDIVRSRKLFRVENCLKLKNFWYWECREVLMFNITIILRLLCRVSKYVSLKFYFSFLCRGVRGGLDVSSLEILLHIFFVYLFFVIIYFGTILDFNIPILKLLLLMIFVCMLFLSWWQYFSLSCLLLFIRTLYTSIPLLINHSLVSWLKVCYSN